MKLEPWHFFVLPLVTAFFVLAFRVARKHDKRKAEERARAKRFRREEAENSLREDAPEPLGGFGSRKWNNPGAPWKARVN